jgi:hypothetical protein
MGTRSPEGGNPYNIDPKTLRAAPEPGRFGSGFKKPDAQDIQGADKPIFEGASITEAEKAADERCEQITKKMERYTEEQEDKISLEWFDKSTAWLKSHGFTSKEDITPEKFTREQQLAYAIETAAMFEEIMERIDSSLDEAQGTQRPDTPPEQDTTGDMY